MTKWAINIMGHWDDTTGKYSAETIEQLFEVVGHKFEPMKVIGVAVKSLPDDHIVIEKKSIKKRTGILGKTLDKNKQ